MHYGVSDVASVVFRDRFGCWAFLEMWRIGSSFSDADAEALVAMNSSVTTALRRCQVRTFELEASESQRTGPVVLILSPQLAVRAQTPETEQFLKLLVPPDADRRPIPAGAYNVGAQLLAVEAGVDTHPPTARVHVSGGLWLTLRAARIGGTERAAGPRHRRHDRANRPTRSARPVHAIVGAHSARGRAARAISPPVPTPARSLDGCSCQSTRSRTTSKRSSPSRARRTAGHCSPARPDAEPDPIDGSASRA